MLIEHNPDGGYGGALRPPPSPRRHDSAHRDRRCQSRPVRACGRAGGGLCAGRLAGRPASPSLPLIPCHAPHAPYCRWRKCWRGCGAPRGVTRGGGGKGGRTPWLIVPTLPLHQNMIHVTASTSQPCANIRATSCHFSRPVTSLTHCMCLWASVSCAQHCAHAGAWKTYACLPSAQCACRSLQRTLQHAADNSR